MSSIPFSVQDFSVERRQYGDAFWRSLFYFNVYRLVAALVLLAAVVTLGNDVPFGSNSPHAYLYTNVGYIIFSMLAFAASQPVAKNPMLSNPAWAYCDVDPLRNTTS